MTTSLDRLKRQLNILDNADDDLLGDFIAAAETFTTNAIGADDPVAFDTAPPDMQLALLLLAAHYFENREATVIGASAQFLPLGYFDLIASYRNWVV